jgi:hypothetical protein
MRRHNPLSTGCVGETRVQIIGGASILAQSGGGLYWTVAGIIFAIAGAVGNAWVPWWKFCVSC